MSKIGKSVEAWFGGMDVELNVTVVLQFCLLFVLHSTSVVVTLQFIDLLM